MPRAKNPEFFKSFRVTVFGSGSSPEQAKHNFDLDMDYKKKWIRGALQDDYEVITGSPEPGVYVMQAVLLFLDRKQLNASSD